MKMNSLADLKKNAKSIAERVKESTESKQGGRQVDERFWSPTFDATAGTGEAVVRFLPPPVGEEMPFVKLFFHSFKGVKSGKWYIENSLSTLGQKDPCGELNSRCWNSGIEAAKEISRRQKRKVRYYANVLVINDPANPEANGNVYLWKFGQEIFNVINAAMFPEDADDQPVNPFDPWDGHDFKLKMKGHNLEGRTVPRYDKSAFKPKSSPLAETDEEIEEIWKKAHSLSQFTAPTNFKSYAELQKRLVEVVGISAGYGIPTIEGAEAPEESDTEEVSAPRSQSARVSKEQDDDDVDEVISQAKASAPVPSKADDDDDWSFLD